MPLKKIKHYAIVEKSNPLRLHAICNSEEGAKEWLTINAPLYCERSYFDDKNLTPNDFIIKKVY